MKAAYCQWFRKAFTSDGLNLGYGWPGGFGGGPFGTGSLGAGDPRIGAIPLTPGGAGTGYPSGGKDTLSFLLGYRHKIKNILLQL